MPRAVYFEIRADNPERAAEFYRRALGWDIKKSERGEHWRVITGPAEKPGINGAIIQRRSSQQERTASFVSTIAVDSLDEAILQVSRHGGRVIEAKRLLPGIGGIAYCEDTEGNTFGLFEREQPA